MSDIGSRFGTDVLNMQVRSKVQATEHSSVQPWWGLLGFNGFMHFLNSTLVNCLTLVKFGPQIQTSHNLVLDKLDKINKISFRIRYNKQILLISCN